MSSKKEWIQTLRVVVDSVTGALHVQQGGLENADLVELTPDLPNNDVLPVALGAVCHRVVLSVPAGASCRVSFKGTMGDMTTGTVLEASRVMDRHFAEGVSTVWVRTGSDMSAYEISIEGE